jgi:hypothetical protein
VKPEAVWPIPLQTLKDTIKKITKNIIGNSKKNAEKPKKKSKNSKGLNGNCNGSSPLVMSSLVDVGKVPYYICQKRGAAGYGRAQSIKDG